MEGFSPLQLRVRAGMTLRDVAKFSGVSARTVCYVEHGKIPHPSTSAKIAKALRVSETVYREAIARGIKP